MSAPYFMFKFYKYPNGHMAHVIIRPDLTLWFFRAEAPILKGRWRYWGTWIDDMPFTNSALLPEDGYWQKALEMTFHDHGH